VKNISFLLINADLPRALGRAVGRLFGIPCLEKPPTLINADKYK